MIWEAATQPAPTFFGTAFLNDQPYFFQRLADRAFPSEFMAMVARDTQKQPARYTDIMGDDAGRALRVLPWSYIASPLAVGVFGSNSDLLAISYATLIRFPLDHRAGATKVPMHLRTGINLSFAVDSEHEGKSLGFLAACLAVKAASQEWPTLDHRHKVNIQTKTNNGPGIALATRLGAAPCEEAGFSFSHPDGALRTYCGFRSPWSEIVANASAHLSQLLVLADFEEETDSLINSAAP